MCWWISVGSWDIRAPQGPLKRLEPFVFYRMTKRDEVQFGASSKRFRLVADCEAAAQGRAAGGAHGFRS